MRMLREREGRTVREGSVREMRNEGRVVVVGLWVMWCRKLYVALAVCAAAAATTQDRPEEKGRDERRGRGMWKEDKEHSPLEFHLQTP